MLLSNIRKSIFLGIFIGILIQFGLLYIGNDDEFNVILIIKMIAIMTVCAIFLVFYNYKKNEPILSNTGEAIIAMFGLGLTLILILIGLRVIG